MQRPMRRAPPGFTPCASGPPLHASVRPEMGPGAGAGVTAGKARRHPGRSAAESRGPSRTSGRCARCGGRRRAMVDHDPPYLSPQPPHGAYSPLAPGEGCAGSITALPGAAEPACPSLVTGMARAGRAPEGPRREAEEPKGPRAARGEGVGSPNRADTVFIDPPSARKPRAGPSSSAKPARTDDDGCAELTGGTDAWWIMIHPTSRSVPATCAPSPRGASDVQERAGPQGPSPQASAPGMRDVQERAGSSAAVAAGVSR